MPDANPNQDEPALTEHRSSASEDDDASLTRGFGTIRRVGMLGSGLFALVLGIIVAFAAFGKRQTDPAWFVGLGFAAVFLAVAAALLYHGMRLRVDPP